MGVILKHGKLRTVGVIQVTMHLLIATVFLTIVYAGVSVRKKLLTAGTQISLLSLGIKSQV